jgi:hypothetical protein
VNADGYSLRVRNARLLYALVATGTVLVVLSIALKDAVFAALALVAFAGVLLVLIVKTLPSMRYKQSVKHDHSFITNVLGGTSEPHPGPSAPAQTEKDESR